MVVRLFEKICLVQFAELILCEINDICFFFRFLENNKRRSGAIPLFLLFHF